MAHAHALVGNSSSAILEAPCFDLAAVNVGARQEGRLRLGNVIDVAPEPAAIAAALAAALARTPPGPRRPHPTAYGDGRAAERIAAAVATLVPGAQP
jgi:UDP-N-acetylglucosamine 2-epimerase